MLSSNDLSTKNANEHKTATDSPRDFLLKQIDYQIQAFNKRRQRYAGGSNKFSVAQIIASAASIALVAVNIHFSDPYVSLATIAFSLIAVICGQFLQYFKYQERLQMAIATVSRLHSLKARI